MSNWLKRAFDRVTGRNTAAENDVANDDTRQIRSTASGSRTPGKKKRVSNPSPGYGSSSRRSTTDDSSHIFWSSGAYDSGSSGSCGGGYSGGGGGDCGGGGGGGD